MMKLQTNLVATAILAMTVTTAWSQAEIEEVDFSKHVKPILESACVSCHNPDQEDGELRLDTRIQTYRGGEGGPAVIRGNPEKSSLYTRTVLPEDDPDIMPPEGPTLSKQQTEILRRWIKQGAKWPRGETLETTTRIHFTEHVQPILELNCVSCHREGNADGGLRLDVKSEAFADLEEGPSITPFEPEHSRTYTTTVLPADDPAIMPPKSEGEPLSESKTQILKSWIRQGAVWPDGVKLTPRAKEEPETEVAGAKSELRKRLMAKLGDLKGLGMENYTETIPGTSAEIEMVPIPGGSFMMGSPKDEKGRDPDEGPQHKVKVSPFWMAKFEITWQQYELFMYPEETPEVEGIKPYVGKLVDAVGRPTAPYVEMSFGMGKDGFPAISMTQYAARKFCEWLSAKTGHYYRLPTEAEWEYACRAGSSTAYWFGDDPEKLDEYAWYKGNSNFKYHKVGTKKPNPWGLYNMHGNVAEWCLDQYDPDYYEQFKGVVAQNPYNVPTSEYPRSVRGGSWEDEPADLRSAVRRGSKRAWKALDPQLPKSRWYHTSAQFLGFRIVRPLNIPSADELPKYWTRE